MSSPVPLQPRAASASTPAPLAGIRVVDFTRVLAGPFATQILGELGAEVIKIESPHGGDDTRASARPDVLGGETPFFVSLNRSKSSVAIDLKSQAGIEVALDLIATADILVENFSSAVMRRFGLDYASLKERFPKLIYCSISGYGRSGRNADAAGYDSPLSAEAGIVWLNSYSDSPPVLGGTPFTDITTALNATIGILAALQACRRDEVGQHVDVAMFDSALANLSFKGVEFLSTGSEPQRGVDQMAGPRGRFDTADGSIVITCGSDKMFTALCRHVIDREQWLEDDRFVPTAARIRNGETFLEEIRPLFLSQSSAYWSGLCKRVGIPCGEVRSPGEALLSEEATDRGSVFALPHATAGTIPAIAQPFVFSRTPCRYEASPLLGEHTRMILHGLLGYEDARIKQLLHDGAVAVGPQDDGNELPGYSSSQPVHGGVST